ISVSRSPSVVVRVYLPPWEHWERRYGNSFCFRAACQAYMSEMKPTGWFGSKSKQTVFDTYWPGMLIGFTPGDGAKKPDSAFLSVRAGTNGGDMRMFDIKEPGWWTLGMSFTPDGQIHYYAHAGVKNLTEKDRIASEYPYDAHCVQMSTFFFD